MRHYPIKRGFKDNLQPENLKALVTDVFGPCTEEEGKCKASYGAIRNITVWSEGKDLAVDTEMDPSVSDEVAMETI